MARKKVKSETAEKLANALAFVSVGIEENKETWKQHARIVNGYLVAFNGQLAAGHPIEEPFSLCPHIPNLIAAINKSGNTLAMTETERGNLQVNGENIRATVPCLPMADMPPIMPDPNIAVINDELKEGFKTLLPLTVEDGDSVVEYSILVRGNSMVATNRTVMFEYWHGIDLPPGLAILRAGAIAVRDTKEALVGFGYTPGRSATFWFEGGAFIQCRLAADTWPDVNKVLDTPGDPKKLPAGFFDGIEAVASFSADGAVHFDQDKVRSGYANYGGDGPVYGATYDVPGMVKGSVFTVSLLKLIKPVCGKIDYTTNDDRALFFGPGETPKVRGVIMKRGLPNR